MTLSWPLAGTEVHGWDGEWLHLPLFSGISFPHNEFCPLLCPCRCSCGLLHSGHSSLHENMVLVTGTEGPWVSQSLVQPLQSGISVKWVTFCSDVFNAREQVHLSLCLTWESALSLHTLHPRTSTGKAFSPLSSVVLPCWLSPDLKGPF